MASNNTCRACARAVSRSSSLITSTTSTSRTPISTLRILPSQFQTRRHASTAPQAKSKPAPSSSPFGPDSKLSSQPKPTAPPSSMATNIAARARKAMPLTTETYVAYGATEDLIKECARQADYTIPQARERDGEIPLDETGAHIGVGDGWWYEDLGLQPTFINWAQITFLHMFMFQVRFRMLPDTHSGIWIQHLTNHMFYAAEDRLVVWHQMTSTSIRQRYLKDNFALWRAVLLSYDEGMVKGDAELAAAVWRNLFAGREEFMDFERLAMVVGYMRREIRRLEQASDDEVVSGEWKFERSPGEEKGIVGLPSARMKAIEKA